MDVFNELDNILNTLDPNLDYLKIEKNKIKDNNKIIVSNKNNKGYTFNKQSKIQNNRKDNNNILNYDYDIKSKIKGGIINKISNSKSKYKSNTNNLLNYNDNMILDPNYNINKPNNKCYVNMNINNNTNKVNNNSILTVDSLTNTDNNNINLKDNKYKYSFSKSKRFYTNNTNSNDKLDFLNPSIKIIKYYN